MMTSTFFFTVPSWAVAGALAGGDGVHSVEEVAKSPRLIVHQEHGDPILGVGVVEVEGHAFPVGFTPVVVADGEGVASISLEFDLFDGSVDLHRGASWVGSG